MYINTPVSQFIVEVKRTTVKENFLKIKPPNHFCLAEVI